MRTNANTQLVPNVGANLRAAREQREMTQKQVGDAIGVRARDVSRWENGHVEPGPLYRSLLAELFFDGRVAALYEETESGAAR